LAIELIDKIKQKNNGNFKLVDAIDVELKDGSDLQNFIDNINDIVDVPSSSKCHNVVQGENEPEQDDVIIWVDTSNSENVYSDSLGDKVINEFREIFKYLTNEIKELKAKNLDLEARVSFLEQNGTGGGGNNNPDKPDKPDNPNPDVNTTSEIMTFEDGSLLIDEEGNVLVFSITTNTDTPPDTTTNAEIMVFEDGTILTDEEGNILAFSITNVETPPTPDTTGGSEIMTLEDGSILIDEIGNILAFSIKSNNVETETETNDTILILETKEILITENNEILKFEK